MKKNVVLYFLSCIWVFSVNAQKNENKVFGGLAQFAIQDQLFSPLIYSGINSKLGFEISKLSEKKHLIFGIFITNGKLTNEPKNTVKQHAGQFSFSYLKPIDAQKKWNLGLGSHTNLAIRQFQLAKKFGAESYSGDLFTTINFNLAYLLPEKKWGKLKILFDSPIAGIAFSRKNFDIVSNPDLIVIDIDNIAGSVIKSAEIIGPKILKMSNLTVNYSKKISPKNTFDISLNSQAYDFTRLNNKVKYQNLNILVGFGF